MNKLGDGFVVACVTENYEVMKKLITAMIIGAFAFVGTASHVEARPYWERGLSSPNSTGYANGYRYDRPVYTERIFIGYDCYGRPKYAYRTYSAPVRSYPQHCDTRYSGHHGGYYDNHRSSGASVSFSFGRR